MADISYTPTFHHVAWEDRKDRVEAAGPNGFNVRFNAIASDLRQLSTVVTRVGAAIDATNVPPPPQQQRLNFTPKLGDTSNLPPFWGLGGNGEAEAVVSPNDDEDAVAVANLTLPHQFRLTAMRVVGSVDTPLAASSITLARTPLRLVVPPPTPEPLAALSGLGAGTAGAFALPVPITASRALIDTGVFRYVLTVSFGTLFGSMKIEAVQLTFAPPS